MSGALVAPVPVVERRVLCLVLPNLLCELVMPRLRVRMGSTAAVQTGTVQSGTVRSRKRSVRPPRTAEPAPAVAVVLTEQLRALSAQDTLDAINETARHKGIVVGQSIAEAQAQLAQLQVRSVSAAEVQLALGQIAESVLQFGVTAALHAPDTVCLDITGVAHLFGGEAVLATQVAARVRSMGHRVRVAVANGPVVAQALARWANYAAKDQGVRCFSARSIPSELAALPIAALPLQGRSDSEGDELLAWLIQCGLYSVGDLKRLPKESLSARLGASAAAVGDFIHGQDATPLVPYLPAPQLCEEFEAEEGMKGVEPLLFVLKGLCARMSARLLGRAQAVRRLKVVLMLDRSIAALHGAAPNLDFELNLPTPIFRAEEIERIVVARSKRLQLEAPILTVQLSADDVTEAPALQLDLSRVLQGAGGGRPPGAEVLPVLFAEISAEIGMSRIGVLHEVASHIPEGKSVLQVPVLDASRHHEQPATGRQRVAGKSKRTAQQQAVLQETVTRESSRGSGQRSFFELIQEQKAANQDVRAEDVESREIKLQPTRLFSKPIPLAVKLEPGATVVIGSRLFTIDEAQFERRLSEIEWWSATAISRDYWRLWLKSPHGGCSALAFVERKTGQRFLQALYD